MHIDIIVKLYLCEEQLQNKKALNELLLFIDKHLIYYKNNLEDYENNIKVLHHSYLELKQSNNFLDIQECNIFKKLFIRGNNNEEN